MTLCLIIAALTVASFLWGKFTLGTTAMISMMLFYLTGILDGPTVLACFGNSTAVMLIGMFVVAAGFNKTQFVKNVANWIAKVAKGSLTKVLFGYIVIAILLCQFISSNLIPFCIIAPLMINTVEQMGYKPSKVVYPLGIACVITCQALPLGAGATQYAQLNEYLASNGAVQQMSILDPMISRLPLVIIMAIYCIFIAPKFTPDEPVVSTSDMNVDAIAGKQLDKKAMAPFQEKSRLYHLPSGYSGTSVQQAACTACMGNLHHRRNCNGSHRRSYTEGSCRSNADVGILPVRWFHCHGTGTVPDRCRRCNRRLACTGSRRNKELHHPLQSVLPGALYCDAVHVQHDNHDDHLPGCYPGMPGTGC